MKSFGFIPLKGTLVHFGEQLVYVVRVKGHQSLVEKPLNKERIWVDNFALMEGPAAEETGGGAELDAAIPWNTASEKDKELALIKYEIIQKVLRLSRSERTRSRVDIIAQPHEYRANAVYCWLRFYDGTLDSLLPRRKFRVGNLPAIESRLDARVEAVVREVIEEALNPKTPEARLLAGWQRVSIDKLFDAVESKCLTLKIVPPSRRTVMRRKKVLIDDALLSKLALGDAEHWKHVAAPGKFDAAKFPYAIIQIDHTLLNIVVLDQQGRPIGCPWITVAIDVYSRCVVAFRVSLDPPSAGVVGLVISRTILPKNAWFEKIDPTLLVYKAPFYGRPAVIHTDNGSDLKAAGVLETLSRYGIDSDLRPTGKPNYGGHIENLVGTLTKRIYGLPGAKPERTKVPRDYSPEKYATYTVDALERWLAHQIFGTQNHDLHEGIQEVPVDRFIHGLEQITGAKEVISGVRARELETAFLPSFEATVQRDGVTQHGITWWSSTFRAILARFGTGPGKSFQARFRYEPDGMKKIWFINPLNRDGRYESATWSPDRPDYSEWEVKAMAKELKQSANKKKLNPVNQDMRFQAMARQRQIDADQAATHRPSARRAERRVLDKKKRTQRKAETVAPTLIPVEPPDVDVQNDVLPAKGGGRWKR
jgi:putative transposase